MKYKKGKFVEFINNGQLWNNGFNYKYLDKVCRIVNIMNKEKKLYKVAFKRDNGTMYYTEMNEIFLKVTNKSLTFERKQKLLKINNK